VARQVPLARLEHILDASGVAPVIEQALPAGVRPRQLPARTLLPGQMLALAGGRPAYPTETRAALLALPAAGQERPGVIAQRRIGPHPLTCRQVEHTNAAITSALSKPEPDGAPSPLLLRLCHQLIEAGIPANFSSASSSVAVDWTGAEAWSRPVPADKPGTGTGPEARWAHRNAGRGIQEQEMSFGYLLSAAVMVAQENGPAVPELARRITVCSSAHDPPAEPAAMPTAMPADHIAPGDVIADSGYSRRVPETWADPLRAAGAQHVLAPSSPAGTCTAPPPRSHYWRWRRCRPAPPRPASPPTTRNPANWPATSSASTPATTPTATAGTPAPPPPARSAAPSSRRR
jgi:hypothetical protein